MSREATGGARPTSLLPLEETRSVRLASRLPQERLGRSRRDGPSQVDGFVPAFGAEESKPGGSSSLRAARDQKSAKHHGSTWKGFRARSPQHSSMGTGGGSLEGMLRAHDGAKPDSTINRTGSPGRLTKLKPSSRGGTQPAQFPYYDTQSESEEAEDKFAEERRAKGDWLAQQKKEFTDQQRRFQALIDRLRLREGEFHVAPSVRNNILSKLQQSLPSPASLTFSSPTHGADASCSSRSSSPPPPLELSRSDDDFVDPAWTEASALVRQLQQVYDQRDQLEKWVEEQRRLQKELVWDQAEQERQKEKKEWQAQVTKQLAASREAQKVLEESCGQLAARRGGEERGGRPPVQQHLEQLLKEKPPESISTLIQAAQNHGDDIFCLTGPVLERGREGPGETKEKGRRASVSPVVKCRPGFTLHVQSIQLCWSLRERRTPGEEREETEEDFSGDDSRADSETDPSSGSSAFDPASGEEGHGRRAGRRKGSSSKTPFPPSTGRLSAAAVSYCLVARYAEDSEGGGSEFDDELPVYTTAWYGASVVSADGTGTRIPQQNGGGQLGKNNLQQASSTKGRRLPPKGSKREDTLSRAKQKDSDGEANVNGEDKKTPAREEEGKETTQGRSRARLAEAFLGKTLGGTSHPGVAGTTNGEGLEPGGGARDDLTAPAPPPAAITLVKEACVMDTDITLPQLSPVQASRANSSCVFLHIWRHEKRRKHSRNGASHREDGKGRDRHRKREAKLPKKQGEERKGNQRKSDIEDGNQFTYMREEVGRVVVNLDDPRVYDRAQSIFTVTPLLVGLSPLEHRQLVAQAVLERHLANTQGAAGVQFPLPGVQGPLGRKAQAKLSVPARAFAASGTLYAFVLRTVSRPEPPPAVVDSSQRKDGQRGKKAAKDKEAEKQYKPLQWKYVDDFKVLQGPFPSHQMLEWIREGYFEEDAPVCLAEEPNRLLPLKVILPRLREDAAAYGRHRAALTACKEEGKQKEGKARVAVGVPPRSPSPREDGKPTDSCSLGEGKTGEDKGYERASEGKPRSHPPSLAAVSSASSTRRAAGMTLTTTADSVGSSRATSPVQKQTGVPTSPGGRGTGGADAGAEGMGAGTKKLKGAEVENVMKLLQEATNCLSRISSHRMSSYLQCTVGQREAGAFPLRPSQDRVLCESEATDGSRVGTGPCRAAGGLPAAPVVAAETGGAVVQGVGAGRSAASRRRSVHIQERMRALEEMFGTAAVKEACAVYIQAAVRGWLQRLRFWRFLQSRRLAWDPRCRAACWQSPGLSPSCYSASAQGSPANFYASCARAGQILSTGAEAVGHCQQHPHVRNLYDLQWDALSRHDPRIPPPYRYPVYGSPSGAASLYSAVADPAVSAGRLYAAAGPLPANRSGISTGTAPSGYANAYLYPSPGTACPPSYPAVPHVEPAPPRLLSPSSVGTIRSTAGLLQPPAHPACVGVAPSPRPELLAQGPLPSRGAADAGGQFSAGSIPDGSYLSYTQMAAERGLGPPSTFPVQHF